MGAERGPNGGADGDDLAQEAPGPGLDRGAVLLGEGPGRRVLLVTSCAGLRQQVTGICASAGARLRWSPDLRGAEAEAVGPAAVDIVLLDAGDLRDAGATARFTGPDVVLLGASEDGDLWELAAQTGDCSVAVLPEAEAWLADRIASGEEEPGGCSGAVLGVLGAVGGVGASTLACWLAAHAGGAGWTTALVDADPDACGLDLLLGLELQPALRWPDLTGSQGTLSAERLWEVLPGIEQIPDLRWLSWGRGPAPAPAAPLGPVLRALRRACELIVVDLGRGAERSFGLVPHCDVVLAALPRTVRGILAAERVAASVAGAPVELVLCGAAVSDLDVRTTGELLEAAPLGPVRFDPRVPEAAETGRLLERGRRRPHAEVVADLWEQLELRHGLLAADEDRLSDARGPQ